MRTNWISKKSWLALAVAAGLLTLAACSMTPPKSGMKRMPEGQQFSGFLKDYESLKPNPKLEGEALTYVSPNAEKNLRRYVAIIVDPVQVYVSTKADDSQIPDHAREVIAQYFQRALANAVGDAFPVVETPGPLVLRLRAAVVGIDTGGDVAPLEDPALTGKPLPKAIVLEKVGVETELVDSVTGERIAAMVDKTKLGEGAEVGTENFSRVARYAQAREALDHWAGRLRMFLDTEHELTGEDADRADKTYRPYGQ